MRGSTKVRVLRRAALPDAQSSSFADARRDRASWTSFAARACSASTRARRSVVHSRSAADRDSDAQRVSFSRSAPCGVTFSPTSASCASPSRRSFASISRGIPTASALLRTGKPHCFGVGEVRRRDHSGPPEDRRLRHHVGQTDRNIAVRCKPFQRRVRPFRQHPINARPPGAGVRDLRQRLRRRTANDCCQRTAMGRPVTLGDGRRARDRSSPLSPKPGDKVVEMLALGTSGRTTATG